MQASKLVFLCFAALLATISASAIPATATTHSISLSSRIPSANLTNITTNSDLIPHDWHGQPYCTPTGEGYCNLAFYWFHVDGPGPDGTEYDSIFVYDRWCNVIGWKTGVWMMDFDIYSSLPYVVVGYIHELMEKPMMFRYAAGSYGDRCYEYCGSEECFSHIKQCAFRC